MQIANAGVKIFEQNTLFLKPGRRYIQLAEEEQNKSAISYRENDPIANYWIVIDFQKGYAPILPSRVEIDIDKQFAEELKGFILQKFCDGLREVVTQEAAREASIRLRRKRILSCLTDSIKPPEHYWRETSNSPPFKLSNIETIEHQIVDLYSEYCPLRIQTIEGEERLLDWKSLDKDKGGFYVRESIAKTGLFKIFARALGITEWITVEHGREFLLAKRALGRSQWRGIYSERDIYEDGRRLFTEKIEAPLTQYIRGDYALVDSDIFGANAFVVLPANLPNSWRRADASKYSRAQVSQQCPARVLLNANHALFKALDDNASKIQPDSVEGRQLKLALDGLADGVIEQDRITMARERWAQLKEEFSQISKISLRNIGYESLHG
jgi:hypothetical protein